MKTIILVCKECFGIYGCSINGEEKLCKDCPTYYRRHKSTCLAIKWESEKREGCCPECAKEVDDDDL